MSEPRTSTEEILVHFVRPGVGTRDYHLAEGATLADLFRRRLPQELLYIDAAPEHEPVAVLLHDLAGDDRAEGAASAFAGPAIRSM